MTHSIVKRQSGTSLVPASEKSPLWLEVRIPAYTSIYVSFCATTTNRERNLSVDTTTRERNTGLGFTEGFFKLASWTWGELARSGQVKVTNTSTQRAEIDFDRWDYLVRDALASKLCEEDAVCKAEETAASKLKEHFKYLKDISEGSEPIVSKQTADLARKAWSLLWQETGYVLPIPSACTGPDGQILYSWDKGEHHFEVEIIPGKPMEFFYRNRKTGELWGEEYTLGDSLPAEAAKKLKLFM
jgi:hypothetical protein